MSSAVDRGDLDAFCAELRGKGVSFKIASTHATNPAQKASGQAAEVLPIARQTPPVSPSRANADP
jgi:hypothetical protein